ncbi:unnamed protein product [Bathycoccus prasinos]
MSSLMARFQENVIVRISKTIWSPQLLPASEVWTAVSSWLDLMSSCK